LRTTRRSLGRSLSKRELLAVEHELAELVAREEKKRRESKFFVRALCNFDVVRYGKTDKNG